LDRHVHRIGAVFPWPDRASRTERVAPHAAEGVPPGDGEAKMFLHRLAFDDLVGVIVAEAQCVRGIGAFVADFGDFGEEGHGWYSWCRIGNALARFSFGRENWMVISTIARHPWHGKSV